MLLIIETLETAFRLSEGYRSFIDGSTHISPKPLRAIGSKANGKAGIGAGFAVGGEITPGAGVR
jgi:hypothetical protein